MPTFRSLSWSYTRLSGRVGSLTTFARKAWESSRNDGGAAIPGAQSHEEVIGSYEFFICMEGRFRSHSGAVLLIRRRNVWKLGTEATASSTEEDSFFAGEQSSERNKEKQK
jgi:hypothetical protein